MLKKKDICEMINLHCCNDQYALNANYYVYISIISLLGYYLEER